MLIVREQKQFCLNKIEIEQPYTAHSKISDSHSVQPNDPKMLQHLKY